MRRLLSALAVMTATSLARAGSYETIVPPTAPEADLGFGRVVALDGSRLLAVDKKGIKIFDSIAGVWTQSAAIAFGGLDYGNASLRGDWGIVTSLSGSAFVHRSGTSWTTSTTMTDVRVCGLDTTVAACVTNGGPIRVYTPGSTLALQTTVTISDVDALAPALVISGNTFATFAASGDQTAIFTKGSSSWTEQARIAYPNPFLVRATRLPTELALEGDRLVIGIKDDSTLRYQAGSVAVYERSGTTWTKAATLTPPDPVVEGWFGASVSLVGDRILVAATKPGRFYLFRRVGTEWKLEAGSQSRVGVLGPFVPIDPAAAALSASVVAIGTPAYEPSGIKNAGAVFVYPTTCTADENCSAASYCGSAGTCLSALANGSACDRARQCGTSKCVDGFCCDLACDGQCEACDVAGKEGACLPVAGAPHGKRPTCTAGDGCATQSCDGSLRGACGAYVGSDVSCRAKACANGFETTAAVCDGSGSCPASAKRSCDGFTCDGDACRTACSSATECLSGFTCKDSKCVPITELCGEGGASIIRRDGSTADCTPYACRAGACLTHCAASNECAPGYICGGDHSCIARDDAAISDDAGGCAFGLRSPSMRVGVVVMLMAAALRRRRGRAAD